MLTMEDKAAEIIESPEPTEAPSAGVEHGTIVVNSDQEQEKIVYDYDEAGNVIGWHKEVVNG